ncbi:MAG TPA: hypothetical protein VL359_09205 [bacterium]|nr:hypothetical protein [bacterium]
MTSWRFRLGVVAVFALGVLVGAGGISVYWKARIHEIFHSPPSKVAERVLNRLSRDLDLTAEQREKARPIVVEAQAEFAAFRQAHLPELFALMRQNVERLKPILTPEQQERLEKVFAKMQERWKGQ